MELVNKFVNKEMLTEFSLEMGRIALVAVLPILITSLEAGKVDMKLVAVTGIVAVLKAVDRALYETGAVKKGLIRF